MGTFGEADGSAALGEGRASGEPAAVVVARVALTGKSLTSYTGNQQEQQAKR